MKILDEFNKLFDQWYESSIRSTSHWLRFNCTNNKFSLKDRYQFVEEEEFERRSLKFTDSNDQETIDGYYDILSEEVKNKILSDNKFKFYKFDQVLWSVSRIIGRRKKG